MGGYSGDYDYSSSRKTVSKRLSEYNVEKGRKYSPIEMKVHLPSPIGTIFCRSLDFGNKALYNFYCIGDICNSICDQLSISKNNLVIHVASGHIYEGDE